jgi:hypothetical protein
MFTAKYKALINKLCTNINIEDHNYRMRDRKSATTNTANYQLCALGGDDYGADWYCDAY